MSKSFLLLIFPVLLLTCSKADQNPDSDGAVDLNTLEPSGGVMMQAFYWDVEPRGEWWNTISSKIEAWKKIGVDRIWLPPATKGASGGFSMGYDPMDYFDFGDFNQMGTTETRFGSRTELENLISKAHSLGVEVIADIVLNHNSGGDLEFNPFRNKNTYTSFKPRSGRFPRTFKEFHPNDIHTNDAEALFFEEQDICHDQPHVREWLWTSDSSMAKYYKNTLRFDGWRFDYVKGFAPEVIKSWLSAVGGFAVLEAWDGNTAYLKNWVDQTGARAFDFANFYNLEQAFDGNNLRILAEKNALYKAVPDHSVTFVANHDTEKDSQEGNRIGSAKNKLLAYAYILTHPGYPCIFYLDYESQLSKSSLDRLMLINRTLAKGTFSLLYVDADYYIAQRLGSPGLIVAINNSNVTKRKEVLTTYKTSALFDYSENTGKTVQTNPDGLVMLETPAKSYTIWSLKQF